MKIHRILQFDFLPRNTDAGLLVLRLWLGLSLLVLHGWSKLTGFSEMSGKFPDPIGVGSSISLALTIFAEVACAVLIAAGLLTRAATATLIILMGVAFFVVHKGALSGPGSGELAFIYLAGFVTLLLTGAGKFSFDARLLSKTDEPTS
jgi:putative oxidoreductase